MTEAERDILYWLKRIRDGVGTWSENWQGILNILLKKGDAI